MDKNTETPNCDILTNKLCSEKMNISYSEYVGNMDCEWTIKLGNISKYDHTF